MLVQIRQHRVAFPWCQADDVISEELVHIKRPAPGFQVSSHHGMLGLREPAGAHVAGRSAEVVAVVLSPGMERIQLEQKRLHRLRERLVGCIHVSEQGVAAVLRHLVEI